MSSNELKKGDRARIVKPHAKKYNPHITHQIGDICVIEEIWDDGATVQIVSGIRGWGNIDLDCLERVKA